MALDWQQLVVLGVLVGIFVAFMRNWASPELIALSGAGVLFFTGILSPEGLLDSFSNQAPVTIGCLFVLSAALERTGLIDRLAAQFNRFAKGREKRALCLILIAPLVLSAFMNNTPLVVILLPVVLSFCRQSGVKPSRLLMPLSFATILGGTCSMAGTSTNLLVDGIAREYGMAGFELFEIAKLGVVYAVIGIVYLLWLGPKLLPARDTLSTLLEPQHAREFLVQAAVPEGSGMIGKPLPEALKNKERTTTVLEVRRRGVPLDALLDEVILEEGDRLLIRAGTKGVDELRKANGINIGLGQDVDLKPMEEREAVLMEGIVGPNSPLLGQTLREIGFRQRFNTLILAIHREGVNITRDFENVRLAFGDTLLVEGPREGVNRLMRQRGFVALTESQARGYRREKAPWALLAMVGFIAAGASGVNLLAAGFGAALAVLLLGCLTTAEAYEAVDWKILFLIIGMLAIASAMEASGIPTVLGQGLATWFAPLGPWVLLSATYLLATVMTEMISNSAVAVLLTPLVIRLAEASDVSPVPFIVAVMFGASASFATPIGYQTNTYVFGAGGYRFSDFVRVGAPLNVLLWLAASALIPVLWPF